MNHHDPLQAVLTETAEGLFLSIVVQPRASHNQIVEIRGNELKVRLTSPPVDGSANKLCIEFLAKILGAPKSDIKIVRGEKSRHKVIKITGLGKASIVAALETHCLSRGSE